MIRKKNKSLEKVRRPGEQLKVTAQGKDQHTREGNDEVLVGERQPGKKAAR